MNRSWEGWNNDDDQRRQIAARWKLKRSWKLQKCKLSGNLILPGTKAWCKKHYDYYSGKSAFSDWVTVEAYIFEKLKDTGKLDGDL